MNAVIGFGFVTLGLAASVLGAAGGTYALLTGRLYLLRTVRQWVWLILLAAVGAFTVMEVALFQRDYTVAYVSQVGSDATPPLFNFAAIWSALEGSILLWTLVLAGYLAAMVVKFRKRRNDELLGWALVVMLVITSFFFALMVGPANPFLTTEVEPGFVGPGPNPLLQNHILVAFHPPMLYLGYVGFAVPFAFAIAALITGRLGEGWLVETRRWTVAAWGFLTAGHPARGLVELRGPRLGRLLGLGPGRERLPAALADRHRLHPLGDGPGAAGHAAGLEPVAGVRHVLPDDPRHLPDPVRGGRVGPCLQRRPGRPLAAGVLRRPERRRLDRPDRLAG